VVLVGASGAGGSGGSGVGTGGFAPQADTAQASSKNAICLGFIACVSLWYKDNNFTKIAKTG
jgi:hypothetical protein